MILLRTLFTSYSDAFSYFKRLEQHFEFYNNERFHKTLDYKMPRPRESLCLEC
jgi:transposase InsO family protein